MDSTVDRTHNYPMTVCPHCGREVPAPFSDMHASVCAHRPEIKARILTVLTSDVPGVGVRIKDYDKARLTLDVPPVSTLLRGFGGTWESVLEAFGLTAQPKKRDMKTPTQRRMTAAQREQAACDDVAAMADATRRIMAAEYDAAHTLKALHVHDAPGLYVNGRPCQRVELR